MRIEDLSPVGLQPSPIAETAKPGGAEDFGKMLMDALKEINQSQTEAGELRDAFVRGDNVEIHDVLIALEKSGVALQLAVQVRNKLLEAYQEINRIPV
jgi:flagellar hook-basal body complex protein FliE